MLTQSILRRDWLALLAGGALANPSGYIDSHVHVWTPDRERYPRAKPFEKVEAKPASFTADELFAHARPLGVARVVLIQMSFYQFDNSYMLDTMAQYPGVFSGVGIVDEASPDPEQKMRTLAQRGVRGFRIRPVDQPGNWLDTPAMAAMWKYGADRGLAMCPLLNPDALSAVDSMCSKFPDTTVVIDHLARIGADGHVRNADVRLLCSLARHKRVHAKVSAFYALGKKKYPYRDLASLIRRVYEAYGPERLMWATDCPFQVQNGHTYSGSVELVRDRLKFLTAGDKEWLLRKTAEKVFFA